MIVKKMIQKNSRLFLFSFVFLCLITACGKKELTEEEKKASKVFNPEGMDTFSRVNEGWKYDKKHSLYYRTGVPYTAGKKEGLAMSIFVPADYFDAQKNDDGYTCTVTKDKKVGAYDAASAPIWLAIDGDDISGQKEEDVPEMSEICQYTKQGVIYVFPGYRGGVKEDDISEQGGIPWSAAELKAAIRMLRYTGETLPGDVEKIVAAGDGTLAAILGSSGDSALYFDYLESMGAVMKYDDQSYLSDAVSCAICENPGLSGDVADGAYEWLVGQYYNEGCRADGTFTGALSDDLAESYGVFVNEIQFKDAEGETLSLKKKEGAIYAEGSYVTALEGLLREASGNTAMKLSEAVASYWMDKHEDRVGFYDAVRLEEATEYNALYGDVDGVYRHFDSMIYQLLQVYRDKYETLEGYDPMMESIYAEDLAAVDKVGIDASLRCQMYNPIYYLKDYYDGKGQGKICSHWMIYQDVTAKGASFLGGANLFLALGEQKGVDVSYKGYVGSVAAGTADDISYVNAIFEKK